MMRWRAETIAKDPASDWKTPINFYGLVLDENNQPLSGANVKWITTTIAGNGKGTTTSGSDGRFFIGTTGKEMNVMVQKDGYRTVERGANFEFAAFFQDNYYDHDEGNPVIFHLRKIPPFEPIYIRMGTIRDNLVGTKITIDPKTGGIIQGESAEGMWIQFMPGPQNAPDRGQYDIVLGTDSGGGAILVTGDSDENAPTTGYQTSLDTQTSVDYDGHRFINMKAFFKDGTGNYGSMSLDIELGGNKLTMGYLLKYNPSGGTSLSAPVHSEFQINKNSY